MRFWLLTQAGEYWTMRFSAMALLCMRGSRDRCSPPLLSFRAVKRSDRAPNVSRTWEKQEGCCHNNLSGAP